MSIFVLMIKHDVLYFNNNNIPLIMFNNFKFIHANMLYKKINVKTNKFGVKNVYHVKQFLVTYGNFEQYYTGRYNE